MKSNTQPNTQPTGNGFDAVASYTPELVDRMSYWDTTRSLERSGHALLRMQQHKMDLTDRLGNALASGGATGDIETMLDCVGSQIRKINTGRKLVEERRAMIEEARRLAQEFCHTFAAIEQDGVFCTTNIGNVFPRTED